MKTTAIRKSVLLLSVVAIAPLLIAMSLQSKSAFNGMLRGSIQTMFLESAAPALVKEITEKALLTNRKAALGILSDFGRVDLKSALAAAKNPVRCINASAPRMAPPTTVETNRKYADYKAVTMDGVGHYLMIERPAEFNKLLREALKELMAK